MQKGSLRRKLRIDAQLSYVMKISRCKMIFFTPLLTGRVKTKFTERIIVMSYTRRWMLKRKKSYLFLHEKINSQGLRNNYVVLHLTMAFPEHWKCYHIRYDHRCAGNSFPWVLTCPLSCLFFATFYANCVLNSHYAWKWCGKICRRLFLTAGVVVNGSGVH